MSSRRTCQAACHVVESLNLAKKRRRRRTCRTEVKDAPFARQHPTETQCTSPYSLPPPPYATSLSSPATPTPREPANTDIEDVVLSKSWSHTSKSVQGMNFTVFWEITDDSFKTKPGSFGLGWSQACARGGPCSSASYRNT